MCMPISGIVALFSPLIIFLEIIRNALTTTDCDIGLQHNIPFRTSYFTEIGQPGFFRYTDHRHAAAAYQ